MCNSDVYTCKIKENSNSAGVQKESIFKKG